MKKKRYDGQYRFVRKEETILETVVDFFFELHEVYYAENEVAGMTEKVKTVWGYNKKDIKRELKKTKEALNDTYLIEKDGRVYDSYEKLPKNWRY